MKKIVLLWVVIVLSQISYADCVLKSISFNSDSLQMVYKGEGDVVLSPQVILSPKISIQAKETHAALVLLNEKPTNKFHIEVEYEVKPLREKPNPWEVFWLFFNYKSLGDKKKTNYFILKSNGIELGKAYNELDQDFLFTKDKPKLTSMVKLKLIVQNKNVKIWINQKKAIDGNYDLYDHKGQIGLYTEDARVVINSLKYCDISN